MAPANGVEPLYVRHQDVAVKDITSYQMCLAMERVIGGCHIIGAQKIKNIWHLYVTNPKSRVDLYINKTLLIVNKHVPLYDKNPINMQNKLMKNDKLTIKDVPMSISNDAIRQMLEENGVKLASQIKDSHNRDEFGNITDFKNGDRFVYVEPFDPPIKRNQQVGGHPAIVIHHGKDNRPCLACNKIGHKIGSAQCPALPTDEDPGIYAFRSYENPLSNHFPCSLILFDDPDPFKSVEHAFFWKMCIDLKLPRCAEEIKQSKHAGEAKRLSKRVPDTTRYQWESENDRLLEDILYEKGKQCEPFLQVLNDNREKVFAEATNSPRYGTGLNIRATQLTKPEYWPGMNKLGAMITDMASDLDNIITSYEEDTVYGSAVPSPFPTAQEFVNEEMDDLSAFEDAEESVETSSSEHQQSTTMHDLSTTLVDKQNDSVSSLPTITPDTLTSTPKSERKSRSPRRKLKAAHARRHRSASASNSRDEGVQKFMNLLDKLRPTSQDTLNSTDEHSGSKT